VEKPAHCGSTTRGQTKYALKIVPLFHGVILHPPAVTGNRELPRKATKRAAPKTSLRGLCALCVKSSHAKLAKNAKELEWPGRRRRAGVATNKGSARTAFRAFLCFSWLWISFPANLRQGKAFFPGFARR
jgi:hypothetical protein